MKLVIVQRSTIMNIKIPSDILLLALKYIRAEVSSFFLLEDYYVVKLIMFRFGCRIKKFW